MSFLLQVHFENFLSDIGHLYYLDNIIRDINKYNSGENSCVIEVCDFLLILHTDLNSKSCRQSTSNFDLYNFLFQFASSRIALQFLGFKPLVYGNVILNLECLPPPHDEKDPDWNIKSNVDANDSGEDNDLALSLDSPMKTDSLKGVPETEVFLELCKERIDPKTKKFEANTKKIEEISDELRSVHTIKVYGVQCRDRFRGLSRNYLTEKKKGNSMWIHLNDMAYLRGEGKTPPKKQLPLSKAKVIQYKPAKAPKQKKKKNTDGNNE